MDIKNRRIILFMTIFAGVLIIATGVFYLTTPYRFKPIPEKPQAFITALRATGEVREDLIKRGLIVEVKDTYSRGQIKVFEIEKFIRQGVYALDKQGNLTFGPNYYPPPER